jgi:hypothetical protein
MSNPKNLHNFLVVKDLLHIVTHALSGVSLLVKRLGALSIAQKLERDDAVAFLGEFLDLVTPVENGGWEAVEEEDGLAVWAGGGNVDVVVSETSGGYEL